MELSERRLHPTLRRENSGLGKRFDTWGPVVLDRPDSASPCRQCAAPSVAAARPRGTRGAAARRPRVGGGDARSATGTRHLHPDLYRFDVGSSQHERVVLASDGVWDFVTPVQAAKITRNTPGAREASAALLRLATDRSHAKFGALKDDVSVIVVDLNPGALDVEKPLASPGTPERSSAASRALAPLSRSSSGAKLSARRPPRRARALSGSHYVCTAAIYQLVHRAPERLTHGAEQGARRAAGGGCEDKSSDTLVTRCPNRLRRVIRCARPSTYACSPAPRRSGSPTRCGDASSAARWRRATAPPATAQLRARRRRRPRERRALEAVRHREHLARPNGG